MQYISRLILVVSLLLAAQATVAQPPARQKENTNKSGKAAKTTAVTGLSERAKSQYPGTITPQEVEWKRDIYRELDLSKEKNASLYYPVEPMGGNMNLFTFLFENIIEGNITAYEYSLDGYESFSEEKAVDPKLMLEDYRIYYEEENGKIIVGKSDIPSAEVKSYFIKESHYYDSRRGSYGTRVVAICPVMHRNEEFSSEETKIPMFWVNYDEVAPLLARQSVMTSSLNNISTMSLDDYFTKGSYDGDIYKTVNLKNQAIAQYCQDSTAVKKEQQKIEQQLKDFRTNLWNTKTVAEIRQDSIDAAAKAANDSIEAAKAPVEKPKRPTRREQKENTEKVAPKVEKKSKSEPAKANNAARVSVRRTRR